MEGVLFVLSILGALAGLGIVVAKKDLKIGSGLIAYSAFLMVATALGGAITGIITLVGAAGFFFGYGLCKTSKGRKPQTV